MTTTDVLPTSLGSISDTFLGGQVVSETLKDGPHPEVYVNFFFQTLPG